MGGQWSSHHGCIVRTNNKGQVSNGGGLRDNAEIHIGYTRLM